MKPNKLFSSESFKTTLGFICFAFALVGISCTIWGACRLIRNHKNARDERELSADVVQYTRDGVSTIVNTSTGQTLIKNIKVDWIQEGRDSLAVFSKDKLRGYFNIRTGEVVVAPQYKHAWIFSEGLAGVVKDGKVGFIDTKGREVIPCRYPYHGNSLSEFVFSNGHCVVADSTQKIGVIDTLGRWVIEPLYEDISLAKDYALVSTDEGFKKQVTYDGEVLLDCVVDYVRTLSYEVPYVDRQTGSHSSSSTICEDYYEYTVNGRSGLMSRSGEFLTAPIYRDIQALGPCTFRATLLGSWSEVIIDEKGRVLSKKR